MKIKLYLSLLLLLSIFLYGCQSQVSTEDKENLYKDAEYIYTALKEQGLKGYIDEDVQSKIDEFTLIYIDHYKKYDEPEKEIVSEIEGLINSYKFYFVAVEQKDEDSIKFYKEKFNESIINLNQ